MPFTYRTAPLQGNMLTSRPVYGPDLEQAEIDTAVAAATGLTTTQCQQVLNQYLQRFITAARDVRRCFNIGNLLQMRPTSGGSITAGEEFHNATELNCDISFALQTGALSAFRAGLSIQKVGDTGYKVPVIEGVFLDATGAANEYLIGQMLRIEGDDLFFNQATATLGVFFEPAAGGAAIRASVYGKISPSEIYALCPAGLVGNQRVTVKVTYNGSGPRSSTYTAELQQAV